MPEQIATVLPSEGGAYLRDPETGEITLQERTAPPAALPVAEPTITPALDQE